MLTVASGATIAILLTSSCVSLFPPTFMIPFLPMLLLWRFVAIETIPFWFSKSRISATLNVASVGIWSMTVPSSMAPILSSLFASSAGALWTAFLALILSFLFLWAAFFFAILLYLSQNQSKQCLSYRNPVCCLPKVCRMLCAVYAFIDFINPWQWVHYFQLFLYILQKFIVNPVNALEFFILQRVR